MEGTTARSSPLHSREKKLVYDVYKYFLEEKANRGPIIDPSKAIERTAKATKLSTKTISRVCSQLHSASMTEAAPEPPVFSSPKKKQRRAPVTSIDDFDKQVVRRTVLRFYERKEIPTLQKINEELKENISFNGSIESLRRILKKIGFIYGKVNNRKFLMERSDVANTRTRFLRKIRHLRQSAKNMVYLDETWVNQNYTVGKCWQDNTSQQATGINAPTGKGSRLIVLHAGTKAGFVNNAELIFQAKNDGDYHHQMNSSVFEEWFKNQLLPNITPNSVIVMDNAPYHSVKLEKHPTSSWRKGDIKDWLVEKGAQPTDDLLKRELYEMAKTFSNGNKYRIDTVAEEAGHEVVRLPPYHCQYNPIELVWAQVKTYVAQRNTFKMADLKPLLKEALRNVTPQNWMEAVRHAEQLQDQDARQDIAVDFAHDPLIIDLSESSDEEFDE